MTTNLINALRLATRPVNGVTPFTYRDGKTYLEILEALRDKINELVAGFADQNIVISEFTESVNGVLDAINTMIEDLQSGLSVKLDEFQSVIDEAQQFIDDRDEFFSSLVLDTDTSTREALNAMFTPKSRFVEFRNSDGAVNQLLRSAYSYLGKENFVYGNYHTNFNTDSSAQSGLYEIDCSSFVQSALMGISYENTKYFNTKNYPNNTGLVLPSEYNSPSQGRYLANDLAFYAYEMGWTFEPNFSNVQVGDVYFLANNPQAENWREIGHVGIVTRVNQRNERSITVIDADLNRFPVVQEQTFTIAQLIAKKTILFARYPLQDSSVVTPLINFSPLSEKTTTTAKLFDVNTTADLVENQVYTLFFKTQFADTTRYPTINLTPGITLYSFGHGASRRPDGFYRANFIIPQGKLAEAGADYARKLSVYLTGASPYPQAHTSVVALYEGYVTEYPGFVDASTDEGVFTPEIKGETAAGSHTYTSQVGRFTLLGDRVFFECHVSLSAKDSSMDGNVVISGLPYPARPVTGYRAAPTVAHSNLQLAPDRTEVQALIYANENVVRLQVVGAGDQGDAFSLASTRITATTDITLSGNYLRSR